MIAEELVPRVAHHLGNGWVCDELDFSAVTIGASRLQSVLHRLDRNRALSSPALIGAGPTFLVGVPEGVQHTLGATVITAQLRHRGYRVDVELEMTPSLIAEKMRKNHYTATLISTSGVAKLENCRQLVESCKKWGGMQRNAVAHREDVEEVVQQAESESAHIACEASSVHLEI